MREHLFSIFAKRGKQYELLQDGDHIAVCISGGKDSMLMAKLFQEIKKHRQVDFEVSYEEVSVVHNLAFTPDYQGYGLGDVMVSLAIDLAMRNHCKSIRLDSLASNTPAHHLYKKHGFEFRGKLNLMAQNTGSTDFFFFEKDL